MKTPYKITAVLLFFVVLIGCKEETEQNNSTEKLAPFVAGGFEPSWSLEISEDYISLMFSHQDQPRKFQEFSLNDIHSGVWVYDIPQEALQIKITKKDCVAEGKGNTEPYEVVLIQNWENISEPYDEVFTKDGEAIRGCGWQKKNQ